MLFQGLLLPCWGSLLLISPLTALGSHGISEGHSDVVQPVQSGGMLGLCWCVLGCAGDMLGLWWDVLGMWWNVLGLPRCAGHTPRPGLMMMMMQILLGSEALSRKCCGKPLQSRSCVLCL